MAGFGVFAENKPFSIIDMTMACMPNQRAVSQIAPHIQIAPARNAQIRL